MQISGESLSFVLTVCVLPRRSESLHAEWVVVHSLLYLGFSGTSFVEGGGCGSRELADISCR